MAKVDSNIITTGLRGKVGNIIFRKRGNKTTAYVLSPRKTPFNDNQVSAQQRFAQAVAMARESLQNKDKLKKFTKMARKENKESAYSAAVSYYMKNLKPSDY